MYSRVFHSPRGRESLTRALTDDMGDASEEWQAVRDVSVGDVVGSYDPVTGQWLCGRYEATHAGGVQPTVKTDHADHAVAQRWSMPMQQHMHGHGPLMTAPMLSMSSTPSLPPMPSMPPVHSRPNVPSTMRRTPWAQGSPMPPISAQCKCQSVHSVHSA